MADSGIGSPQDSKATNTTGSWSLIALLKYLIDQSAAGASGDASAANQTTQITAEQAIQTGLGAPADTHATTDAGTFSLIALFKRLLEKLTTQLPAALGSGGGLKVDGSGTALPISGSVTASGTVGIDQTTVGTTDSVTIKASVGIGSLTETAPTTDIASSGLNGRLQRIAQNITTLIAKFTLDGTTKIQTSLYGKASAVGDTAVLLSAAGRVSQSAGTGLSGGAAVTGGTTATFDSTDTARALAVAQFGYNGASNDPLRTNFSQSLIASAAKTATENVDFTVHNARSCVIFLNITVAPNTAGTLTLAIREKDSISSNYVSVLTGAAILGSASQSVPVTNRYVVALGVTVASNTAVSDALSRTMNVIITHSTADSWTYSLSADLML